MVAIYIPLIFTGRGLRGALDGQPHHRQQRQGRHARVARDSQTWIVALLYIGTFGSFIGFGFAFGQVLQVQFAHTFATPVKAAYLTFLGPLLGSLVRPWGGKLADRIGGSTVTFWNFVAMAAGASWCCSPPPRSRCRST